MLRARAVLETPQWAAVSERWTEREFELRSPGARAVATQAGGDLRQLVDVAAEDEDGEVLDVRLPLGRHLEELHAEPLDAVDTHCNRRKIDLTITCLGRFGL